MMVEQKMISGLGGTMRLGKYKCTITPGTRAFSIYNHREIEERHRHRYEFNNKYSGLFTTAGMIQSGINSQGELVEIIEIPDHPWFVGVQFHPEYKSTVANPHPVFVSFVNAAKKFSQLKSNPEISLKKNKKADATDQL